MCRHLCLLDLQPVESEAGEAESKDTSEEYMDNEGEEEEKDIPNLNLERFKEIELFIAEKLYQQGKAADDLFSRFDPVGSGALASAEFRAALAGIGISVFNDELRFLAYKFPVAGRPNEIAYKKFLAYLSALRASRRSGANSALLSSAVANRPPITPEETRELLAQVQTPFVTRLQRGIKLMREYMYARSVSASHVFKILKNEASLVDIDKLAKEVLKYGFPSDLVDDKDLQQFLSEYAVSPEGKGRALTFFELSRFVQGLTSPASTTDKPHKNPSSTPIITNPALVAVLVKINSLSMRDHFREIDQNQDGLVTVDEILADLHYQGLNQEICKNPAVRDYITQYSVKVPGKLSYDEYYTFASSRMGQTPKHGPHAKFAEIEVPTTATPSDLVYLLHDNVKKGISLESVFQECSSPVNSRRITESDMWHALSSIGFTVPRELNAKLFRMMNPENDVIDYNSLIMTIHYPNRNPLVTLPPGRGSVGSRTSTDNVPLGSAAAILESFHDDLYAPKKDQIVRNAHRHKFDDEAYTADEAAAREGAAQRVASSSRNPSNRSTVNLADATKEEVAAAAALATANYSAPPNSARGEARGRAYQQSKGQINFGGDHGGPIAVPKRAGASGRASTIQIGMPETFEVERTARGNIVAEKTASDIFHQAPESPKATRKNTQRPITPGHVSKISFNQDDVESYTPMKHHVAPPGGQSSMKQAMSHDIDNLPPVTESITGHKRRGHGSAGIKASIDLSFDPTAEVANAPGNRTSRRQFDNESARGSVDHLGSGAVPAEEAAAIRRARGQGAARPAGNITTLGTSEEEDSSLVHEVDSRMMTPRTARRTAMSTTQSSVDNDIVNGAAQEGFAESKNVAEAESIDFGLLQTVSREVYAKGKVKNVFSDWSKGANTLTAEQFVAGTKALGFPVSAAQTKLVFAKFDKEQKGSISFGEFVRILSSKPE